MVEQAQGAEFFEAVGLRSLNSAEERKFSSDYKAAMLKGLRGEQSSVPMFPSLLSPVELGSLREGSTSLVVEIGGTNLYSAQVGIQDGHPTVLRSYKELLPGTKYESADDFFSRVANGVAPVMEGARPDAIGIVYSFPGEPVKSAHGVDVMSPEQLTKQFVVPGISNQPVGEALKKQLAEQYGVSLDLPTVVLNDTVAVLFSNGAKLGGVVGTGFNLAFATPDGIANSESGGFIPPVTNTLADEVDRTSTNLGQYLAEKQISGLYLGEQMGLIARKLGINLPQKATAELMSTLLSEQATDKDRFMLREGAVRLRDRSAQLVGLMVGTVVTTFPSVFKDDALSFPIEGSLFWKMNGYSTHATEVASRVAGRKVSFLDVPEAGRVGAAVAALGIKQ